MAELLKITMTGDKALIEGRLFDMIKVKHLLKSAVDDIADEVEGLAKKFAPKDTGVLKLHPVDRRDSRGAGIVDPRAFSIGGGLTARGDRGRFVGGGFPIGTPGELVAKSTITVAKKPEYAIWVHDGTGIHGPRGKVITAHDPEGFMTFPASRFPTARFKRKDYRFKFVEGQKAQPYLTDAFLLINRTYVPGRIELLRAQIAAET